MKIFLSTARMRFNNVNSIVYKLRQNLLASVKTNFDLILWPFLLPSFELEY